MIDIKEYRDNLDLSEYGGEVVSNAGYYDDGYSIDDLIWEVAKDNVDVYNADLFDFIAKNPDRVEEAIESYGWDGVGGTLIGAAQFGETLENQEILNDHLDNIITDYALEELQDKGIEEVDESFLADLESQNFDGYNIFEDVATFVSDYVKEHDLLPSLDEKTVSAEEISDVENAECRSSERNEKDNEVEI